MTVDVGTGAPIRGDATSASLQKSGFVDPRPWEQAGLDFHRAVQRGDDGNGAATDDGGAAALRNFECVDGSALEFHKENGRDNYIGARH